MNIGILCGGRSPEHEISIVSALDVYKKLDRAYFLYMDKKNNIYYFKKPTLEGILKKKGKRIRLDSGKVGNLNIDVVLLLVHGRGTEDGTISSVMDFYNIPYVGSSIDGSYIAMDKGLCDLLLRDKNISVVPKKCYQQGDIIEIDKYPVIVKPSRGGSSLGISAVYSKDGLADALNLAYSFDNKIVVEKYLEGVVEYSQAVYYDGNIRFSPVEIVKSNKTFFDYEEKYMHRKKGSTHQYLDLKDKIYEIEQMSRKIYKTLELKGIVRIDYLEHDDIIYANEINTIPGSLANYMLTDFPDIVISQVRQSLYEFRKTKNQNDTINTEIVHLNVKKY